MVIHKIESPLNLPYTCFFFRRNQKNVVIKFRLQCTIPSFLNNYGVVPNTHIYEQFRSFSVELIT